MNIDGELGNGTYTDSNVPLQVTGLCTVLQEVNEITKLVSITVYPNPSNGIFTIERKEKNYEVVIVNVLGKKVFTSTINHQPSNINHQPSNIDLSSQPDGIYFVQVKTELGTIAKKIILSR